MSTGKIFTKTDIEWRKLSDTRCNSRYCLKWSVFSLATLFPCIEEQSLKIYRVIYENSKSTIISGLLKLFSTTERTTTKIWDFGRV